MPKPEGSSGSNRLPTEELRPDICVIGAGSGGLSVAAAAAAFGRSVVLIEKGRMGGDCLNYGCVPSKALIAAARRAHLATTADQFGLHPINPVVDMRRVREHVAGVIAAIAPNDSAERFAGLGVRVLNATATFASRTTVTAGEYTIRARRFVVATGSSPLIPSIPGLDRVAYFTNETIFENAVALPHLAVIGGGPIGAELAQAYRRLGSKVTLIEATTIMGRDDPELVAVVERALRAEGVDIRTGASVTGVTGEAGRLTVTLSTGDTVEATHLLVAVGRRPNLDGLGLDAARIKATPKGIEVDAGQITSNRRVFAIGDCAGGPQFTHVANDQAGIVIRRALFRLGTRFDVRRIPWVTFTDPELAHVGLTEEQARAAQGGRIRVLRWSFAENDRAQAERATEGFVKVVTTAKGRILGASIVGAEAGELIQVWSLAIAQKLDIKALADWVVPYPTRGEVNKRAAMRYYAGAPANPFIRKAIDWLGRLG